MSIIAVAGAGYVGLTTAACFADLGNQVSVVEVLPERVALLQGGGIPFYEPGLAEMVERNVRAGRLTFTSSYADALEGAEFIFIAVATPEGETGEADLSYVENAARSIATHMSGRLVVINKSTVPIGTGNLVQEIIRGQDADLEVAVVSNPEFLREGSALHDFMHPDRIVIGADEPSAAASVATLYAALDAPILVMDMASAELAKYGSNAMLAARISFMNELARISDRVGADIRRVAEAMGLDHRIGPHFLDAGIGYGGSCFPKDVRALAAIAERYDYHPELLQAVMSINRDQRLLVVDKLAKLLGGLDGRVVGLLGLAFKPNTDDLREAPSLDIARILMTRGASVQAYDPVAMERARTLEPDISYRSDAYEAAAGADALVLVTDWNEFKLLDLARAHEVMRQPVMVDGRNLYDPETVRRAGFTYAGVGRP